MVLFYPSSLHPVVTRIHACTKTGTKTKNQSVGIFSHSHCSTFFPQSSFVLCTHPLFFYPDLIRLWGWPCREKCTTEIWVSASKSWLQHWHQDGTSESWGQTSQKWIVECQSPFPDDTFIISYLNEIHDKIRHVTNKNINNFKIQD